MYAILSDPEGVEYNRRGSQTRVWGQFMNHPEGVTGDVAFWHPAGVHPIVTMQFPGL